MVKTRFRHITGRNVQYLDKYGFWKSTGCSSLQEAKIWYAKNIEKSDNSNFKNFAENMFTDRSTGSFYWIRMKTKKNTSEAYWYNQDIILKRYILPVFGDLDMKDITSEFIQDWYFSLEGTVKKDLKDASKTKYLNCLGTIMSWAKHKNIIETNPFDYVFKISNNDKGRKRFLDAELERMFPKNLEQAINVWGDLKHACYFYIMKDTGWRQGEISALNIDGFFPQYNSIFTTRTFNSFEKQIKNSIKTTGKGYDYKIGILSDFTIELLNEYIKTITNKDGFIFIEKNKGMSTSALWDYFKRKMEVLGVDTKERPPYSIRTTFMTNLSSKYEEDIVKELMGHKQWRRCYDQRTPEEIITKIFDKIN